MTLAAVGFERYAKTTRRAAFLAEMERVVPWSALCALIEPAGSAERWKRMHKSASSMTSSVGQQRGVAAADGQEIGAAEEHGMVAE